MRKSSCYSCINDVLRYLGIKTDHYTKSIYYTYPVLDSFRSIAYTLGKYGVETTLIEVTYNEIESLSYPFIIKQPTEYKFVCSLDDDTLNPSKCCANERNIQEAFITDTESIKILVINPEVKKVKPIGKMRYCFNMIFSSISILALITLIGVNVNWNEISSILYVYLFTSVLGLCITLLFQVYSLNRSNPFINRLCRSNKHGSMKDCSSILDSDASLLANVVSWADIGLMFFVCIIYIILVYSREAINVIPIIYIISFIYVVYSVSYQLLVIKRICVLCMATMMVLTINAVISGIYLLCHSCSIDSSSVISLALTGIGLCAITYTFKRYVIEYITLRTSDRTFKAVKLDTRIQHIMQSDSPICEIKENVGLTVNAEGETLLTIVFNPTCDPCIRKLRMLLKMLKTKNNVCASFVLFFDFSDKKSLQAANMLVSSYMADNYHFLDSIENYVSNYPMESQYQHRQIDTTEILQQHNKWCYENRITSTPTLLIDGQELPPVYTIEDLDYMLT